MPYQKSTNNNEVTFTVQREKYIGPLNPALKIQLGCLSILLAAAPGGLLMSTGHPILAVFAFAAVIYFMKRFMVSKEPANRIDRTFVVTPDGIKIDGQTYTKENIQRIIIRNGFDDLHTNFTGHTRQLAESSYKGAASVNFRVDIESNGTPLSIAIGLNEPTAYAILNDVSSILGMTISKN